MGCIYTSRSVTSMAGQLAPGRGWFEKPNMKNEVYTTYLTLLCACYEDVASAYPAQYDSEQCRDLTRICDRFRFEGVGFLTKQLPSLGKAIDKALSTGTNLSVPNFAKRSDSELPNFLGWLVGMVFSDDGTEKANADPVALMHIRQLLYLFYKLEMPYTSDEEKSVVDQFVAVDAGLNTPWHITEPSHASEIKKAASLLKRLLNSCDPRIIHPKHGPGSVATGEKSHSKPYFRRAYKSVLGFYPLDEYFYMNASHQSARLDERGLNTFDVKTSALRPWEELETGTAKVVLVPKDSRGPRLISMEPLEIQWIQQGQMACLVRHIEANWMTKGHVNFERQEANRFLAYLGSHPDPVRALGSPIPSWVAVKSLRACEKPLKTDLEKGRLVTLDMKEASDRVSLQLVQSLFPNDWVEALESTRSTHTELPSGEVIALNKFAPMGSAVCFPVEALCFWALSLACLMHKYPEMPFTKVKKRFWVYGDDIVCYQEDYLDIEQCLQRVGLLLNANKCCTAGFFKESCGLDAYYGADVTPLRIKKCVPHHWTGQSLAAYVAYSNAAYARGFTNLAEALERAVQKHVTIPYSSVDRGSIQFVRPYSNVQTLNKQLGVKVRFNNRLHILEAYGPAPKAVVSRNHRVTYETFFCKFVSKYSEASDAPLSPGEGDFSRLSSGQLSADQYAVPRRVSAKRGWKQISY